MQTKALILACETAALKQYTLRSPVHQQYLWLYPSAPSLKIAFGYSNWEHVRAHSIKETRSRNQFVTDRQNARTRANNA